MTRISRVRDESGWAIVIVLAVTAAVIVLGLATLSVVDTQSRATGNERVRETSFNLAEAALSAQMFLLSNPWPYDSGHALPGSCTEASASSLCPSASQIRTAFNGTDLDNASTWTVSVRDNAATSGAYYQRALVDTAPCQGGAPAPCTWDSNGDGFLWVRAEATVRGLKSSIVALVQPHPVVEQVPSAVGVAGYFQTTNNGNKVIVDAGNAPLDVRCTSTAPSGGPCMNYSNGQISPASAPTTGFTDPLLSSNAIDQLRARAIVMHTYYASGCPASLTGAPVFIENGNCSYNGGTFNSAASPGAVIINKGTISLSGNATYYGMIYSANGNPPPPATPSNQDTIVSIHGNATVDGSVMVDGQGGLSVGSSGSSNGTANLGFESSVFSVLAGFGDVGIAPNGFRQLTPQQ